MKSHAYMSMNTQTSNQRINAIYPTNQSPFRGSMVLMALALAALALSPTVWAQSPQNQQSRIASLAGPWQATLIWSGSGCAEMTGLLNFTLDASGTTNSAVLVTHSQGCGDGTQIVLFEIESLNAN